MDGAPVTLPFSRSCLSGWEGLGDSPSEELWVEVCVGLCASQLAGDYGGGSPSHCTDNFAAAGVNEEP